jgi:hypothetical protein
MASHTSFDELSKAFAIGAPRRTVLKGFGVTVIGTLSATLLGPLAAHAACVNQGESCAAQKCCSGMQCLNGPGTNKFCCPPVVATCNATFTCDFHSGNQGTQKPPSCGSPAGQCGCFTSVLGLPFCGNRQIFCENLEKCPLGQCETPCTTCAKDTCCGEQVCVPNCGTSASGSTGILTIDGLPII